MAIHVSEQDMQHRVKIEGDFDAAIAAEAKSVFTNLSETASKDVLLDLSEVNFIDSSGIGAIVFLYKRLRCNGYELSLAGVKHQPYELLKLLRIDKIIKME